MKNKSSAAKMQVTGGVLLFVLVLIAELYVMIHFPEQLTAIAGIAVADVVCALIAVNGMLTMRAQWEARQEEQHEYIFKSEKAAMLLSRKSFEELADKLTDIEKASNMTAEEIINAQKGIAKVVIDRNREKSEALMNANDRLLGRFQGITEKLEELAQLVAKAPEMPDQSQEASSAVLNAVRDMEQSLNHAIMQLQRADVSIGGPSPVQSDRAAADTADTWDEDLPIQPDVIMEPEFLDETPQQNEGDLPDMAAAAVPDLSNPNKALSADEIDALFASMGVGDAAAPQQSEAPQPEAAQTAAVDLSDPNKMLSADEIDALIAGMSAGDAAAPETTQPAATAQASETAAAMPDLSDPNKALSADEIDALFASMGVGDSAAPQQSEAPQPAAAQTAAADLSDPNKMLSADEIDALIAGMSAGDAAAPETPEPAATAQASETAAAMPDLSDPNKTLSPDDIAALFASMA